MQPSRELQLGRRGQLGREADRVVDGDRLDGRSAGVGHVVFGAAGVGARGVQQHHRLGGRDGLADPQHLAREVEPAAQRQRDARERYRRNRALLLALVVLGLVRRQAFCVVLTLYNLRQIWFAWG